MWKPLMVTMYLHHVYGFLTLQRNILRMEYFMLDNILRLVSKSCYFWEGMWFISVKFIHIVASTLSLVNPFISVSYCWPRNKANITSSLNLIFRTARRMYFIRLQAQALIFTIVFRGFDDDLKTAIPLINVLSRVLMIMIVN